MVDSRLPEGLVVLTPGEKAGTSWPSLELCNRTSTRGELGADIFQDKPTKKMVNASDHWSIS
jgi:hypothetical protein